MAYIAAVQNICGSHIVWEIKLRSSLKVNQLSACCLLYAGVFFSSSSTLIVQVMPQGKILQILTTPKSASVGVKGSYDKGPLVDNSRVKEKRLSSLGFVANCFTKWWKQRICLKGWQLSLHQHNGNPKNKFNINNEPS
jgi:hypothetical protein